MNYKADLKNLNVRLECAIDGLKAITGAVLESSQEICPEHGEYTSQLRYLEKMPKVKTKTECPKCLRKQISELEALQDKYEDELKQIRIKNIYRNFGIPKRFESVSLDNYIAVNDDAERCLKVCRAYANKWPQRLEQGGGLVMCGMPGTGKNHLAISIGKHIVEAHQSSVVFTSAIKIARDFKSTWSKNSEQSESDVIFYYASPDLLIIDEIGVQFGSDAEKLILFEIINNRYEAMRPTILLSNLPKNELADFIGERVLDRMNDGGGCTLTFTWESYRSRKQAA